MALEDWTSGPLTGFDLLRREMDDVFERFGLGLGVGSSFPAVNLYDSGDDILAAVEAPGVKKEDIGVELREQVLTVTGSRPASRSEGATLLRRERPHGDFMRAVTLPVPVQSDKIEARFKDGILSVKMPKSEAAKPRAIAIQA